MDIKKFIGTLLVVLAVFSIIAPSVSAASDTLTKNDFAQTSFSKSLDYFDYVRSYVSDAVGYTPAGLNAVHANVYMNYINVSGIQMLYTGLENITTDAVNASLQIPMQNILLHYKTQSNADAILSSTFLMMMAFKEGANTVYANSPDLNDTLYASFSLGFDLSGITDMPALNGKTEIIALTHSSDNLQWSWGMRYTNLTALWWRTYIDPSNPYSDFLPEAISTYDELTFTYNLSINSTTGAVTIQENHVIGRMRDLVIFSGIDTHYNSSGTYRLGLKIADDTIYDYLKNNNYKMSIVNYQTTVVVDHTTYSQTAAGQNVSRTENAVSNSSINTYTNSNEKILTADYGTKQAYRLYNYTADPTESTYQTYNSSTRTALIASFSGNTGLLVYQLALMNYLPLTIYHMHPALYATVKDSITNMSRADYFYIISYPTYSGYKINHDPTITAYAKLTTNDSANYTFWIIGIAVVAVLFVVVAWFLYYQVRGKKSEF